MNKRRFADEVIDKLWYQKTCVLSRACVVEWPRDDDGQTPGTVARQMLHCQLAHGIVVDWSRRLQFFDWGRFTVPVDVCTARQQNTSNFTAVRCQRIQQVQCAKQIDIIESEFVFMADKADAGQMNDSVDIYPTHFVTQSGLVNKICAKWYDPMAGSERCIHEMAAREAAGACKKDSQKE